MLTLGSLLATQETESSSKKDKDKTAGVRNIMFTRRRSSKANTARTMRFLTFANTVALFLVLLTGESWAQDPPVFIRSWGSSGNGCGQFAGPHGIEVDVDGNVYVADTNNHRIQKFTSEGVLLTKWVPTRLAQKYTLSASTTSTSVLRGWSLPRESVPHARGEHHQERIELKSA